MNLRARVGASFVFQWIVVGLAIFVIAGALKYPDAFSDCLRDLAAMRVNFALLTVHAAALGVVIGSTWLLIHGEPGFAAGVALMFAWYAAVAGAAVCGVLAFLPFSAIRTLLQRTGWLWLYASAVGALSDWAVHAKTSLDVDATIWLTGLHPTFAMVKGLLMLLGHSVRTDIDHWQIGTENFRVQIGYGCTGMEGISLILVFGAAWLFFFREEMRFPRSLLLLPASVVLIYLLNTVRLVALILIGDAGAPKIAVGGFHSSAGWIFFTCVALGLVQATQSRWLRSEVAAAGGYAPSPETSNVSAAFGADNSTAVFLVPLLAILAVSILTRAASADFDWLYPLRVLAVGAVLWTYRRRYRELDWRFGPLGVILGAIVFAIWIARDVTFRAPPADAGHALGAALAALAPGRRWLWMIFRVTGATITVPIAEELAFRGYALRRLQSADFERVGFRRYTWVALGASSLIFGLTHGDRWVEGTLAGLLFAAAMLRRGRIGEAVAAHATANALLATWVIAKNAWYLW